MVGGLLLISILLFGFSDILLTPMVDPFMYHLWTKKVNEMKPLLGNYPRLICYAILPLLLAFCLFIWSLFHVRSKIFPLLPSKVTNVLHSFKCIKSNGDLTAILINLFLSNKLNSLVIHEDIPSDINQIVADFMESYYKNFGIAFAGIKKGAEHEVFLGGGCGFVSKTIIYPMYGRKDGIEMTRNIFDKTGVPRIHKHDKDRIYGASPHILKCSKYQGKTIQMGLCNIETIKQM